MFDSPSRSSHFCMTQSPKYYHENDNQIFVSSYEPFNCQGFNEESLNLNLDIKFNWSAFSQRTPKTDRISQHHHIQISQYESTFTDRSTIEKGSMISQNKRLNKKQDFSQFMNTTKFMLKPQDILQKVNIMKIKGQLKNLTKNMFQTNEESKQPLQQHVNNNNINESNNQPIITKFKHLNRKNIPTRKNVPKFKKSQTSKQTNKQNGNIQEHSNINAKIEQQQQQQQRRSIQLSNSQLSTLLKIDQKIHQASLQIYRFYKRKEEQKLQILQQKKQLQQKHKQTLQKKEQLKSKLGKIKEVYKSKNEETTNNEHVYIQKLKKELRSSFDLDWEQYFT